MNIAIIVAIIVVLLVIVLGLVFWLRSKTPASPGSPGDDTRYPDPIPGDDGKYPTAEDGTTTTETKNEQYVGLECPEGMQLSSDGTKCEGKCPGGYKYDGTRCLKDCPDNWSGGSTLTHCQHKTVASATTYPLDSCPDGMVKDGAICRTPCKSGYTGSVTTCWANCGPNTIDRGVTCEKQPYQRTGSRSPDSVCPSGTEMWGGLCMYDRADSVGGRRTASMTVDMGPIQVVTDCVKYGGNSGPPGAGWRKTAVCSWQKGGLWTDPRFGKSRTPERRCPSGMNLDGDGMCRYPCKSGFKAGAGDTCSPTCPAGFTDTGGHCTKPKYDRGAGKPLVCAKGRTQKGAVCYANCGEGMERRDDNLSQCSTKCPDGFKNIGVGGCEKPWMDTMKSAALTEVGVCPRGSTKVGAQCRVD